MIGGAFTVIDGVGNRLFDLTVQYRYLRIYIKSRTCPIALASSLHNFLPSELHSVTQDPQSSTPPH